MSGLSYRGLDGPLSLLGTSFQMTFGRTILLQLSTFDYEKICLYAGFCIFKAYGKASSLALVWERC